MTEKIDYVKVNLRKSHPTMYRSIMAMSLMRVALAFNFWFSRPTFTPYDMPKIVTVGIFMWLGLNQIVLLNWFRDIRKIRVILASSGALELIWGLMNTQQFFAGKASLQLPILYVTISAIQIAFLIEPPINEFGRKR